MATKKAVFSTFTVDSLLSSDESVGEKHNLREENEEKPKSTEKESDTAQNFCAGILQLLSFVLLFL
jgi:hypothetical protein